MFRSCYDLQVCGNVTSECNICPCATDRCCYNDTCDDWKWYGIYKKDVYTKCDKKAAECGMPFCRLPGCSLKIIKYILLQNGLCLKECKPCSSKIVGRGKAGRGGRARRGGGTRSVENIPNFSDGVIWGTDPFMYGGISWKDGKPQVPLTIDPLRENRGVDEYGNPIGLTDFLIERLQLDKNTKQKRNAFSLRDFVRNLSVFYSVECGELSSEPITKEEVEKIDLKTVKLEKPYIAADEFCNDPTMDIKHLIALLEQFRRKRSHKKKQIQNFVPVLYYAPMKKNQKTSWSWTFFDASKGSQHFISRLIERGYNPNFSMWSMKFLDLVIWEKPVPRHFYNVNDLEAIRRELRKIMKQAAPIQKDFFGFPIVKRPSRRRSSKRLSKKVSIHG